MRSLSQRSSSGINKEVLSDVKGKCVSDSLTYPKPRGESALFLKRFFKAPTQLGTIAPISERLADVAAACLLAPSKMKVVEIGAGPGRLTRALLKAGVTPENLKAIELDEELCAFAKATLPQVDVIQGDAQYLPKLIPASWVRQVDVVFSTIPFAYLDSKTRTAICEAAFSVLRPGGQFLHLTYKWSSPLKEDYTQTRLAGLFWNIPPGFIWRYEKKEDAAALTDQKHAA